MKKYLLIAFALLLSASVVDANAQGFLKKVGKAIERGVTKGVERGIEKGAEKSVNKGVDQLKGSISSRPAAQQQAQTAQPDSAAQAPAPVSKARQSIVPTIGATQPQFALTGKQGNHEWVDLGLPSGTLWATCNVDAAAPEQPGKHYAWGEVAVKSSYVASNSKYYKKSADDVAGNKASDVATAKWGSGWRMPTKAEFDELVHYCNWSYVQKGGRWGAQLSSSVNDQSIFLPATGSKEGTSLQEASGCGMYWTSTPLDDQMNNGAHEYHFGGALGEMGVAERSYGFAVRPVAATKNMISTPSQGELNGHQWVDLGLPSGTKWATCNVGATSSEDHGEYFAWAEVTPILDKESPKTKARGKWMSGIAGSTSYDAATAHWGEGWRMPTKTHFQELLDNCTFEWTYLGRSLGCKVTSKINGNYIFLPAAGRMPSHPTYPYPSDLNQTARYWASTPSKDSHYINADGFLCVEKYIGTTLQDRKDGYPIRPITQ